MRFVTVKRILTSCNLVNNKHRHDLIFLFENKNWQTSNCKTLVIQNFKLFQFNLKLELHICNLNLSVLLINVGLIGVNFKLEFQT